MRHGGMWSSCALLVFGIFVAFGPMCLAAEDPSISTSTSTTAVPPTTTTTETTPTSTVSPTPTPSVDEVCASKNDSCSNCLSDARCLWCSSKFPGCMKYPGSYVIPPSSTCPLDDARWLTCTVNFKVLLIAMGIVAGILIVTLIVCICCCCRRRKRGGISVSERRADAAENAEYEERRTRNAERRAERQSRYDEIRKKYGLGGGAADGGNSSAGYSRFENDPDA